MKVRVSSHIRSYTGGKAEVEADGATLAAVLSDLDRRYPGLRFRLVDEQERLRPHINVFVGDALTRDLARPLGPAEEISIFAALSGG